MAKSVSQWDASDLQALIGQEETSNLEFKRSDALDNTDGNKRELAKDVSAMANAAGGVIVYGIEEKDNLADALDQGTMQTKEWIDQLLTSNIEPKFRTSRSSGFRLPRGVSPSPSTSLWPSASPRIKRNRRSSIFAVTTTRRWPCWTTKSATSCAARRRLNSL